MNQLRHIMRRPKRGTPGNSDLFQHPARQKVQALKLEEDICVGKAYALSNDRYRPGGGMQYYVTAKIRMNMEKGPIPELTSHD